MFDKLLANKIDNFIKDKFPLIYEYNFDGIVLLFGGTIRSLIMGETVTDLDFVILTQGDCQILDFINKYNLKYTLNAFGSYKINYKNFNIDMFSTNDLIDAGRYNIDIIFYDINIQQFIICGAIKAIENGEIIEINSDTKSLYCDLMRKRKLIKFVKFMNKDSKRVKLRENKLLWSYKMFLDILRHPDKIKKIFRR